MGESIVEGDLSSLGVHVNILEEGTVGVVLLLLDSGTEFHQVLWHVLLSSLKNVDQSVQD